VIESGGFVRSRSQDTYTHTPCHLPHKALCHLGILPARRPSPNAALNLEPRPWTKINRLAL
jgi:hypothetical protein